MASIQDDLDVGTSEDSTPSSSPPGELEPQVTPADPWACRCPLHPFHDFALIDAPMVEDAPAEGQCRGAALPGSWSRPHGVKEEPQQEEPEQEEEDLYYGLPDGPGDLGTELDMDPDAQG